MRMKRLSLYILTGCIMVAGLLLVLWIYLPHDSTNPHSANPPQEKTQNNHTSSSPHHRQSSATLAAVGDVLIHDRVYNKAKTKHGYDFKPMLKKVKPALSQADITVANSESVIGGQKIGLSSYPSFNSPYEVGDALKDAGVNVVTMANNHIFDRGEQAIRHAIHHWDQIGMTHTGSFLSKKDRNHIRTLTRNHITFSFLAYTYGTNGIQTPKGKDYLVNRIDVPQMKKDIKKAKHKSDVVVVSLHFGTEYEREPNQKQKKLVRKLAKQGVDIILGAHPHVLQPAQWIKSKDGHKTFVIYSLGDFFTGQDDDIYKEVGGILQLRVSKTVSDNGTKIEVRDPAFMPTWLNPKTYHVIPLAEAGRHGLKKKPTLYKNMAKHMKRWIPDLDFKKEF